MNFDYILKLDMPLEQAWTTLMDLERIAPCMPGAVIESRDGDDYTGRLKVKLGPMELTYRGTMHFVERDDPQALAVIDATAKEIKGRGAAKTQVTLRGSETPEGSEIALASDFTVSGKAAQFGRGVMEEVGEKLMGDFADRLATQVAAENRGANHQPTATVATAEPRPTAQSEATAPPVDDVEVALDIGAVAWKPLLKRLFVPLAVVAALTIVYFVR